MPFPVSARPELEDILIVMLKVIFDLHVEVHFSIVYPDSVVLDRKQLYFLYLFGNDAFD